MERSAQCPRANGGLDITWSRRIADEADVRHAQFEGCVQFVARAIGSNEKCSGRPLLLPGAGGRRRISVDYTMGKHRGGAVRTIRFGTVTGPIRISRKPARLAFER